MTSRIDGALREHHRRGDRCPCRSPPRAACRARARERSPRRSPSSPRRRAPSSRTWSRKRSAWSSGSLSSLKALQSSRPWTKSSKRSTSSGSRVIPARERGGLERVVLDEDGEAALAVLRPVVLGEERLGEVLVAGEEALAVVLALRRSPCGSCPSRCAFARGERLRPLLDAARRSPRASSATRPRAARRRDGRDPRGDLRLARAVARRRRPSGRARTARRS